MSVNTGHVMHPPTDVLAVA